jgi:hypothetical protein
MEEINALLLENTDECGRHAFFFDYTIIRFVMTGEPDCVVTIY